MGNNKSSSSLKLSELGVGGASGWESSFDQSQINGKNAGCHCVKERAEEHVQCGATCQPARQAERNLKLSVIHHGG
jgi:hypothetical protein